MVGRAVIALLCIAGQVARTVGEYLERHGYDVVIALEAWEAETRLEAGGADIAVISANEAGFDLLKRYWHEDGPPFLALSEPGNMLARILSLELGAADVVDRDAAPRELAARIAGLLGRRGHPARHLLVLENVTVDLRAALLMRRTGEEEMLSSGQIALLRCFLAHPATVLSRDDLVIAAPAGDADAYDRSIDSRIARLRRKLDTESIVSVRGAGYRFDPPAN